MSLLELLIAMVLLAFVALSVTPMLMLGMLTSSVAQEATELAVAAGDRLEFLAALPFSDPALVAGGDTSTSLAGYSEDPYAGDSNRYVRWEISDETAILKRIALIAGARGTIFGPTREVRIETFRANLR